MSDILLARMQNLTHQRDDRQLQSVLNSTIILNLAKRLAQMCQPYGLRQEQRGYWRSRLEASVPCSELATNPDLPWSGSVLLHHSGTVPLTSRRTINCGRIAQPAPLLPGPALKSWLPRRRNGLSHPPKMPHHSLRAHQKTRPQRKYVWN